MPQHRRNIDGSPRWPLRLDGIRDIGLGFSDLRRKAQGNWSLGGDFPLEFRYMIEMNRRRTLSYDEKPNYDEPESENGDEQLPAVPNLEGILTDSRIRSVEDVLDYASLCALAVANGNVPTKLSKELRLWGELMYTCVQAQSLTSGDGDVNFIGQLIQIAGNPDAPTLKQAAKIAQDEAPVPVILDAVAVNE